MAQNGSHHCEEGCLKTENPFQAAWASCPMSGFDPAAVRQLAGLPESHLPVLLVAVGKAATQAQKVRAPVEQLWRRI
ncbi:hypothetical protein CLI92_02960 [Vandammella animalimorsus]|uniref:Nitroreductase domain-containing protein n=1 Tax=Vandammella animalimorsus TaxID=2029117 RepID=A0A2A2T7H9_9BURK|nr:nitroreductase family protein [Vandammella animalimorsus]PAT32777.1 hypothetical protein CK626_03730 [Vandammella animalimorsus]PAX17807.1 hypothetical protein CLI92_02960 [Vandammella animalimorsus]PAX19961.1 hypothetical protein CLI93_04385 [Vandammella animalimorsus]